MFSSNLEDIKGIHYPCYIQHILLNIFHKPQNYLNNIKADMLSIKKMINMSGTEQYMQNIH